MKIKSRIFCNIWNFCDIPFFRDCKNEYQTDLVLKFVDARIVLMSNHNWPVICFLKLGLGKCRHALWQNGPKIDHQKFYWKCNRNLLKCKQYVFMYITAWYIIVNLFSTVLHFMVNYWWYPGGINIWTLSKSRGAGNDISKAKQTKMCYFPFARMCKLGKP